MYKKVIELSKISDEILKAIEIMVNSVAKKLEFDNTYIGIISSVNKDGYTVKYNGTDINIKTKETGIFKKGDTVKFCIPCGNTRKAYIVVDLDMAMKIINQLQTTETTIETIENITNVENI